MIVDGYCTLAELKAALRITDSVDDARLEHAIEGASRMIDQRCNRRFHRDAVAVARVYRPEDAAVVRVDDLGALPTLVRVDLDGDGVFEQTWTAADWQAEPLNAPARGRPWRTLRAVRSLRWPALPTGRPSVEITGLWGWPSVPTQVREACVLQAARIYKRHDSPESLVGSEFGLARVPALDPDVARLVSPLRLEVAG